MRPDLTNLALAHWWSELRSWEAKASPTGVIQRDGHVTVFLAITVNDPIAELWGHSLILKKGKRKQRLTFLLIYSILTKVKLLYF